MKKLNAPGKELKFPNPPLVYFLTDKDGTVVYVGKAFVSMFLRLSENHYRNRSYEKIFFRECKSEKEAETLEMESIIEYQPKYNNRLKNPRGMGYLTPTEVRNRAAEARLTWGQAKKIIREKKIKTLGINDVTYFHADVLKHLRTQVTN